MNRRGFLGGMAAAWAAALTRGLVPMPPVARAPISVVWDPRIVSIIQERTLARVFRDSLYPKLLFRMERDTAWPANPIS